MLNHDFVGMDLFLSNLYLDAQDIGSVLVVLLNKISLAKPCFSLLFQFLPDILLCIRHYLPHFFLVHWFNLSTSHFHEELFQFNGVNTILQEDVKDWTVDVFTNALTRSEETAKRRSI